MTRQSFPEIPLEALRSYDEPARVERVWRRLELDVAAARGRSRSVFRWAAPAAAAVAVFGAGVLVGVRVATPAAEIAAVAEPQAARAAPGAGALPEPEAEATRHEALVPPKRRQARSPLPAGELPLLDESPTSYDPPGDQVPTPVVAGPAEWERLAEAGDFQAAKTALDREGGVALVLGRASASQLMLLADIARAAGNREQALLALQRVLSAYVSAPEAPIAAWTLGNLLEQAGDRTAAAAAYATYRRLSPAGDFAEDAAARQVDVAISQGNTELAVRAVDEYAQNFPNGRRLAELRKRVAALSAPAATGDTESPASAEPEDDDAAEEPAELAPGGPGPAAPAPARQH